MKAAIYKGIKQMACEERPKPTIIDDGDAIIRVVRACVCGSDLCLALAPVGALALFVIWTRGGVEIWNR